MPGNRDPGPYPGLLRRPPDACEILRRDSASDCPSLGVRLCSVLWLDCRHPPPGGRNAAADFLSSFPEAGQACAHPSGHCDTRTQF